jgi:hypothetical protein
MSLRFSTLTFCLTFISMFRFSKWLQNVWVREKESVCLNKTLSLKQRVNRLRGNFFRKEGFLQERLIQVISKYSNDQYLNIAKFVKSALLNFELGFSRKQFSFGGPRLLLLNIAKLTNQAKLL